MTKFIVKRKQPHNKPIKKGKGRGGRGREKELNETTSLQSPSWYHQMWCTQSNASHLIFAPLLSKDSKCGCSTYYNFELVLSIYLKLLNHIRTSRFKYFLNHLVMSSLIIKHNVISFNPNNPQSNSPQ